MGGKDHPERAARRGERHLLRELPVGQQPHEQLVGPGYPQGWGRPEMGNTMRHLWHQHLPPPEPPVLRASLTLAARPPSPAPLWPPSPGGCRAVSDGTPPARPRRGWGEAHLVDAQHGAPEGAAQPPQFSPQCQQTLSPEGQGCPVELRAEGGCHGVDDHQAGHAPCQQHRHLLAHALQQGVLRAGRPVSARSGPPIRPALPLSPPGPSVAPSQALPAACTQRHHRG